MQFIDKIGHKYIIYKERGDTNESKILYSAQQPSRDVLSRDGLSRVRRERAAPDAAAGRASHTGSSPESSPGCGRVWPGSKRHPWFALCSQPLQNSSWLHWGSQWRPPELMESGENNTHLTQHFTYSFQNLVFSFICSTSTRRFFYILFSLREKKQTTR